MQPPEWLTHEEQKQLDQLVEVNIEEGLHPSLREVVKDDEVEDSNE